MVEPLKVENMTMQYLGVCESKERLEGGHRHDSKWDELRRNNGEKWGVERKKRSGERCRKKTARNSTDNMVLLDGCPPSICSVHCFVNSIKLQASWGGTLLSLPIYLNLTPQTSPSKLAESLPVGATNAPLSPSSTAHTRPLYVGGSLVKQIKYIITIHLLCTLQRYCSVDPDADKTRRGII